MLTETTKSEGDAAMEARWLVETRGDPLGEVQQVMIDAWEGLDLNLMMVSINGDSRPKILTHPEELQQVNPFKPLMTKNNAKYIPEILQNYPDSRVGVLLRPCEMRALKEKQKRESFPDERLATITVDCLSTYPEDDYQWRSKRTSSRKGIDLNSLQFARQGGIVAYRFRSACQACRSPVGQDADINIGVIGLPVRQKILIQVSGGATFDFLIDKHPPTDEEPDILKQRERIISRLLQRSSQTRNRLFDNLAGVLPRNLDALLDHFEGCGECRDCLDVCPLCDIQYPAKDVHGRYLRPDVKQWMISCAGCGMCEQACPNHLPLVSYFAFIQGQILESSDLETRIH